MKVAIVLVTRWWRASIDLDGCAAALARQGHSPVLVCRGNDSGEAAFPVVEAAAEEVETPAFWKALGVEAAIVFSWLRQPAQVVALKEAGARVVLRADSDGFASVRVFPRATWRASVATAANCRDRVRCVRHWARRYTSLHRAEDAELLATVAAADAVAIESPEAAAGLEQIFDHYEKGAMRRKLHVVPHNVSEPFLAAPVPGAERAPRIFCGGRWDDPQKDAPLLCATLQRVLAREPEAEALIAGSGSTEAFRPLARHPRVRLLGRVPQADLPELLGTARFLLSSSRWETQPVGSLEMLCMGGAIVAPPLPGFAGLVEAGESGTLAARRTARALADAACAELARWPRGERQPLIIAARWRARVSGDAVARGLIAALDL